MFFNKFKSYIYSLLKGDEMCGNDEIVRINIFDQTWGNTSLGFNGVGGDMVTTAPTMVVQTNKDIKVFFNGRFAYSIKPNGEMKYKDCVVEDLFVNDCAETVKGSQKYMWPITEQLI